VGYARILKRACRARSPRGETILPNIYGSVTGKPTATIEFCANGNNRSATWLLDQPADAMLSGVSVFDSRTANVHVDQTNDVAYTPVEPQVFRARSRQRASLRIQDSHPTRYASRHRLLHPAEPDIHLLSQAPESRHRRLSLCSLPVPKQFEESLGK
jgi:hypothetical protein